MDTYESCRRSAARLLGDILVRLLDSDPREAAERAYIPGGPGVTELEAMVRELQSDFANSNLKAVA